MTPTPSTRSAGSECANCGHAFGLHEPCSALIRLPADDICGCNEYRPARSAGSEGAEAPSALTEREYAMVTTLLKWREASLEGDASDLADLTDETTDLLDAVAGGSTFISLRAALPSAPDPEPAIQSTPEVPASARRTADLTREGEGGGSAKWSVIDRDTASAPDPEGLPSVLREAVERHSTDDRPECDDGSHHVLGLARNVIEARPAEGSCDHCGQLAPCTERRIAVAFVEVMDAALTRLSPVEPTDR